MENDEEKIDLVIARLEAKMTLPEKFFYKALCISQNAGEKVYRMTPLFKSRADLRIEALEEANKAFPSVASYKSRREEGERLRFDELEQT